MVVWVVKFATGLFVLCGVLGAGAQGIGAALPGGGVLAFSSDRDGNYDLYLMDAGMGLTTNFSHQSEWNRYTPAWSPDGEQLAFTMEMLSEQDIYTIDINGSHLRRLTDDPAYDHSPVWSPNGLNIAFVTGRHGNTELYVMERDGSHARRLTYNEQFDLTPSWSPDGKRIAFATLFYGMGDIFVIDYDGSNLQQLTWLETNDYFPAWSPDGKHIAFISTRDTSSNEIYVVATKCLSEPYGCENHIRRITEGSEVAGALAWSPDGRQIAFVSSLGGYRELYVMETGCIVSGELCSGSMRRLTWTNAADGDPSWRRQKEVKS